MFLILIQICSFHLFFTNKSSDDNQSKIKYTSVAATTDNLLGTRKYKIRACTCSSVI